MFPAIVKDVNPKPPLLSEANKLAELALLVLVIACVWSALARLVPEPVVLVDETLSVVAAPVVITCV